MSELWWCLDCRATVELDMHGRCSTCDSNAVDSMQRTAPWVSANTFSESAVLLTPEYARVI